jgi:hypothetical protein
MDNYPEIRSAIDSRLSESDFKVWRRVSIEPATEADIFASRFHWKLIRIPQHVFLIHKQHPTPSDFERFYDVAFRYAKRAYPSFFPVHMVSTYVLVTCIATERVDRNLIEYVTRTPDMLFKGFCGFSQFPVLLDARTGKAHYFRDTTWFGGDSYPLAQDIVERYIEGLSN